MVTKNGSLSINSENIFPIIKKWLYSDHDIFYRELISNGCDAITKLKKLDMMGEFRLNEDYSGHINVIVDPTNKTITFEDNGLGMTAEEVDEYINQIAFSGATDFIEKYKDKTNEDQIIGHFGLGFYSAFMVASKVDIDTLSYVEGATSVHWECDGGTEFSMEEGDKSDIGTRITIYLQEDVLEFCNEYKAREILKKYCSFMPYQILLSKKDTTDTQTIEATDRLEDDVVIETIPAKEAKDGETVSEYDSKERLKIRKRPEAINDTNPLWARHPNDCTREDYLDFYRKVFMDYKEPLFWIHLNMDYPFNLKGILYFPKINTEYESIEGVIKLYNNQVFIADNIKEVIPEFLMLLKGVIDCPDLPLNVSRSALQNDGFVNKISEYISKKVADKLSGMCKTDQEEYKKHWDGISPFIKYGCLRDDKFCEKMTDYILFKDINDEYKTLPECLEVNPIDVDSEDETSEEAGTLNAIDETEAGTIDGVDDKIESEDETEVKEKVIYYVTDALAQSQYITMFKKAKKEAIVLTHNIDQAFISQLEAKNEGIKFQRVDAAIDDDLIAKTSKKLRQELDEQGEKLEKVFRKNLKNDKLTVRIDRLKNKNISGVITISEESRRMADMMKMYSMPGMDPGLFGSEGESLVLNSNHPLVEYLIDNEDSKNSKIICEQLYDLAKIQQGPLDMDAMTQFVLRSNEIMLLLTR